MSDTRHMKKISMDTLDQSERKVSLGKLKKGIAAFVIMLALAGGGYGAYRMVTGDVVASRFTVDKMNCPACVVTVQEVTGKLPGVVGSDVSLAARNVMVRFRDRQTSPEEIQSAIADAGYPIKMDGLFSLSGEGITEKVVATVNGKPVFEKDLTIPFEVIDRQGRAPEAASSLFTVVGKEILLQAADKETVVVQPFEIEEEVDKISKQHGGTKEEFLAWVKATYGTQEKFNQIIGQRLGIKRLFEDYVLYGIKEPAEKQHKTTEWIGKLFKDADVKIVDQQFKQKLHASVGKAEWNTVWPRMLGSQTELKSLLDQ